MLRWLTAGESHGQALVAVLEGLPAGVEVTTGDVADALARRRLGYGRGARMSFERDEVTFLGGVRHGSSIGSPLAVMIGNTEWPKWQTVMSADPVPPESLQVDAGRGDEREVAAIVVYEELSFLPVIGAWGADGGTVLTEGPVLVDDLIDALDATDALEGN